MAPKTNGALAAEAFTAREIDVARQLIHLRESSASSGTPHAARHASAGSGGSYSSRSVETPPAPALTPVVLLGCCVDWEEDEEHEVAGRQRIVKRYRLIKEIYAATEEIGGRTCRKNKKKK